MNKAMPQLLSAMTPFPYHIEGTQTVEEALSLMQEHHIRHLPVMIEGTIEAIVSERDIKRAQLIGHQGAASGDLRIEELSPTPSYFADVFDPLDQVLELMIDKRADAVVVLKEGAPVGIFTDTDACKTLVALLREHHPEDEGDDAA